MLLMSEKQNLTAALAFVAGAEYAALEANDQTAGYQLFTGHLSDAKALMVVVAEESNPEITYERLVQHFKMLTRSHSPAANGMAVKVLQILESGL